MISVIIPAKDAAQTLGACLSALKQQTAVSEPVELIVVDDGSTDQTAAVAHQYGAILIQHETAQGAAAARNSGLRHAQGDLICFTDADCIPTRNWLAEMSKPFAETAVQGCKGIYATRQTSLVARFVQIEYEDKYDLLRPQPQIDFIDTYSAAYRRELLLAYDGFDERIFYVEDQELSFRLAAAGHKLVFQPDAVVYHLHSDTVAKYMRKKRMIGYWKTQTVRRYPDRAVKDSHTPQVLKLQIVLMALLLLSLAGTLLMPPLGLLATAVLAIVFLVTTGPFVRKAWAKDRTVAVVSPLLLMARALALGLGTARGLVDRLPNIEQRVSRLSS